MELMTLTLGFAYRIFAVGEVRATDIRDFRISKKIGTIEFQFEIKNENIQNLTLQWDSNAAGSNGEIGITGFFGK